MSPHHFCPQPKPGRKTFEIRADKRTKRDATEADRKLASKKRDGYKCRFPGCKLREPIESAHLTHKGIGGDPKLIRTTIAGLVTLCRHHHRGSTESLDSGQLVAEPTSGKGADGPVRFILNGAYIGTSEPK